MREDVQETRCRVCAGTIAADGTLWWHVDGVSRVHRAEPMPAVTTLGCMGTADGASCRHPRAEDDAPAGECAGCGWARYRHVHGPAEDGPILECCAHICGRPTRVPVATARGTVWRTVRYVRHCGACRGMVWERAGIMYTTPEDAAGMVPSRTGNV